MASLAPGWTPIEFSDIPPRKAPARGPARGWWNRVLDGQPVFVPGLDSRLAHGSHNPSAKRRGRVVRTRQMTWQGQDGIAIWTEPRT